MAEVKIEQELSPSSLKPWLLAARPKTLPAGLAPVLVGSAMAYADGALHLASALAALLGALLIQIGTNYANDYYDFVKGTDTADRVGPTRATQAGMVTPKAMRNAMVLVFALALLPGAYLIYRGGWPIAAIGVVSIACGVLYTGGPYPLAYVGLGDLFVLVFFGFAAVAGTYYVQALTLTAPALAAGLMPGLLSTAILTVNNLRDIEGDRRAGRKTLAVRFGARFARAEYLLCVLAPVLVMPPVLCLMAGGHWYAVLSWAAMLLAVPAIRAVFERHGRALNDTLAQTGKLMLLHSVLFSVGWVL